MKYNYLIYLLSCFTLLLTACSEEEYAIPTVESGLQNDCIKRSLGPNLVGSNIEFAYAMAILPGEGKLTSAKVEATIAGATGTYLENRSFYTNTSGVDVGVTIGEPSVSSGSVTTVTFTKDTSAATLRYYYKVPEEARGKSITLTFSATASNGQTVSYKMGPYQVSAMDMKLDLVTKDAAACYISIADMAVYDAAYAAANPDKIDLVYLYRTITGKTFGHALVAPTTDKQYLPDLILPAGLTKKAKLVKAATVRDQQLARLQYGVYVDDLDLKELDYTNAPDFAINMRAESGLWVETSDGQYRAYVFINRIDNTNKQMTISMKRLKMN